MNVYSSHEFDGRVNDTVPKRLISRYNPAYNDVCVYADGSGSMSAGNRFSSGKVALNLL